MLTMVGLVAAGDQKMASIMLANGANVTQPDAMTLEAPAHLAVRQKQYQVSHITLRCVSVRGSVGVGEWHANRSGDCYGESCVHFLELMWRNHCANYTNL
jgi:hypothetical protein